MPWTAQNSLRPLSETQEVPWTAGYLIKKLQPQGSWNLHEPFVLFSLKKHVYRYPETYNIGQGQPGIHKFAITTENSRTLQPGMGATLCSLYIIWLVTWQQQYNFVNRASPLLFSCGYSKTRLHNCMLLSESQSISKVCSIKNIQPLHGATGSSEDRLIPNGADKATRTVIPEKNNLHSEGPQQREDPRQGVDPRQGQSDLDRTD